MKNFGYLLIKIFFRRKERIFRKKIIIFVKNQEDKDWSFVNKNFLL